MRVRTIVVILAAAIGLGVLTGRFVLPARSSGGSGTPQDAAPSAPGRESPGRESPGQESPGREPTAHESPGTGSPAPQPATGPMTEEHLLEVTTFEEAGITGHIRVRDRVGDGRYANAACAGEKTLGETLGGPEAHFRGFLQTAYADATDPTLAVDIEDQVAREVAADAGSATLAENFAERLLLEEVPCQNEPATHWVYGPTQTIDVAPGITASWMGLYDGDLNTTGTAPQDQEPCGGIAILRNGSHYGVLEVNACLDTATMTRVVRTAVTRL
ncbi:hypothetical protein [Streptomyces hoynatensis]|uniref:Sensor domain-containing protein n=1 Tax=Streptomyces hoynatensis TaxID=1141874 RepID=A0A3A9Z4G2_9ACTN|nr:hypothetical protein [Streptomyces hoynatensis]RKN43118.1 hypothetical protein D7294_11545 [Streptomyces hoynatensis]